MKVVYYQRKPQSTNFSIERLFADVRRALPEKIDAKVAVSRFPSRGIWRRIYNMIEAAFRQGDVNHITGDVHFLSLFLHRKRTLLTIHDLASIYRLKGWRKVILLFFWYWLPIKRVTVVTTVSEYTKKDILRLVKIDSNKVRVVHDCVSPVFKPIVKEFNQNKPVILQFNNGKNKNLERVSEALKSVPCHFRIIGMVDKDQESVLLESGVEYSNVYNITDQEILEEYRCCDLLVFASTFEGFGLPIIEAQALGRPVVTSTVCSMPEVAGDAACLVDPYDIPSIRAGILKIINDRSYREELVRRGFENVKRFRASYTAQEYLNIYLELLK